MRAFLILIVSLTLIAAGLYFLLPPVSVSYTVVEENPLAVSTVRIDAPRHWGSGVYLGNGYILTANHVTEGVKPEDFKFTTSLGDVLSSPVAEVVWADYDLDLALIRVPTLKEPDGRVQWSMDDYVEAATLDCRVPTPGETLLVYGYPIDRAWGLVVTTGIAATGLVDFPPSQGAGNPDWNIGFLMDVSIDPGNSGGPVFDADGEVIGISVAGVSWGYNLWSQLNFAVSVTAACDMLSIVQK